MSDQFTPEELSDLRAIIALRSDIERVLLAFKTDVLTLSTVGGLDNLAILLSFVDAYKEQQAALLVASELAAQSAGETHLPHKSRMGNPFNVARVENLNAGKMTPNIVTTEEERNRQSIRDGAYIPITAQSAVAPGTISIRDAFKVYSCF